MQRIYKSKTEWFLDGWALYILISVPIMPMVAMAGLIVQFEIMGMQPMGDLGANKLISVLGANAILCLTGMLTLYIYERVEGN